MRKTQYIHIVNDNSILNIKTKLLKLTLKKINKHSTKPTREVIKLYRAIPTLENKIDINAILEDSAIVEGWVSADCTLIVSILKFGHLNVVLEFYCRKHRLKLNKIYK